MVARWPEGLRCPGGDSAAHCAINSKPLFPAQCLPAPDLRRRGNNVRRHQAAAYDWFLAIYLISQAKTGLSALVLKRYMGVSNPAAWLIHPKI